MCEQGGWIQGRSGPTESDWPKCDTRFEAEQIDGEKKTGPAWPRVWILLV
jgi:hypothetical protein